MADIVLINPRFDESFWGMEHALPFLGKRASVPPAGLALLAALAGPEHSIQVLDENVEPIDYERCARADIVGVTGMIVQRDRMRRILTELKRRRIFTVVGGPWISVSDGYFGALADVVFVGEAEETWPRFLTDWAAGRHAARYQQAERTDMSRVPAPRLDLLKMRRYAFGSVQFTRGCPFTCEFCDIIVIYGRRPRIKTTTQIGAELDGLLAQGMRIVFIVDDNLIGNKRAIRPILEHVVDWQKANGYPITFVTEASIDLADDPTLMSLMIEANIRAVFVGIESPNEASLRETRKLQNVRKGASLVERVHRIQAAGMEVWSGMIVGFDHDDGSIFDAHRQFLADARIATAMIGMLYAIPSTPLYARLLQDRRLDPTDGSAYGSNVIPLNMDRSTLRDGYIRLLNEVYDPRAYFGRLDELLLTRGLGGNDGETRHWRAHPWRGRRTALRLLVQATWLALRLATGVPDATLRREYRRRLCRAALALGGRDPRSMFLYALKCAMHYHAFRMAQQMAAEPDRVVNSY